MPFVVTDACDGCRDCLPPCPVDCFFSDPGTKRVVIEPTECIECLCCYLVCPQGAIFPLSKLPADAQHHIQRNIDSARSAKSARLRPHIVKEPTPMGVQGRSAASAYRDPYAAPQQKPPSWWGTSSKRRNPLG